MILFPLLLLFRYAAEVDVDFVRKSVRAIGRCAIKVEQAAEKCVSTLLDLIQTKVNYVVQEAIVVIKVRRHDIILVSSRLIQGTLVHTPGWLPIHHLVFVLSLQDIFRKYPNKYESIIATLCENLDTLDEPEARYDKIYRKIAL